MLEIWEIGRCATTNIATKLQVKGMELHTLW